jgi:hypothetical protein
LDVLKTINWDVVTFDVLCIETEKRWRPLNYGLVVRTYVIAQGYRFVTDLGRNSWFVHPDFQWSRYPLLDPHSKLAIKKPLARHPLAL